jgi:hypothetical protein
VNFFVEGMRQENLRGKKFSACPSGRLSPYFHDFVAGYGNPAKYTQRLIDSEDLIVVGAAGIYEAGAAAASNPT